MLFGDMVFITEFSPCNHEQICLITSEVNVFQQFQLNYLSPLFLLKLDLPFEFGANDSIKPKMDIVGKYIESCAALPPSVVNSLSFIDVMECFKVLQDFFMD